MKRKIQGVGGVESWQEDMGGPGEVEEGIEVGLLWSNYTVDIYEILKRQVKRNLKNT